MQNKNSFERILTTVCDSYGLTGLSCTSKGNEVGEHAYDYKDVLNFDELISMEIYRHRDDDSLCYIETMDCHGNDYTLRPYEANQKQMQKVIKLSAGENGSKPTSDKMIVLHS